MPGIAPPAKTCRDLRFLRADDPRAAITADHGGIRPRNSRVTAVPSVSSAIKGLTEALVSHFDGEFRPQRDIRRTPAMIYFLAVTGRNPAVSSA